jgi:hypothetical protein
METITKTMKSLNVIYLALILGQLAFMAVAIFIANDSLPDVENMSLLRTFIPVVSVSTVAISYVIYNKRREQGAELDDLTAKTLHYRTSNIIRWAVVEAGNLFAVVSVLLTGSMFFLIFFALGMGVFLVYRPTIKGFVNDYNLSTSEEKVLSN